MSKRVPGKTWRKLNKDDRKDFVRLFTRLLEHTYIGKIEGYSQQKVIFKDQRIKGTPDNEVPLVSVTTGEKLTHLTVFSCPTLF